MCGIGKEKAKKILEDQELAGIDVIQDDNKPLK
jgi:hypothetical protein